VELNLIIFSLIRHKIDATLDYEKTFLFMNMADLCRDSGNACDYKYS